MAVAFKVIPRSKDICGKYRDISLVNDKLLRKISVYRLNQHIANDILLES